VLERELIEQRPHRLAVPEDLEDGGAERDGQPDAEDEPGVVGVEAEVVARDPGGRQPGHRPQRQVRDREQVRQRLRPPVDRDGGWLAGAGGAVARVALALLRCAAFQVGVDDAARPVGVDGHPEQHEQHGARDDQLKIEVLLEQEVVGEGGDGGGGGARHHHRHVHQRLVVAVGEPLDRWHAGEQAVSQPVEDRVVPDRADQVDREGVQRRDRRQLHHLRPVPAGVALEEEAVRDRDRDPERGPEDERAARHPPGGAVGGEREVVRQALAAPLHLDGAVDGREPRADRRPPRDLRPDQDRDRDLEQHAAVRDGRLEQAEERQHDAEQLQRGQRQAGQHEVALEAERRVLVAALLEPVRALGQGLESIL